MHWTRDLYSASDPPVTCPGSFTGEDPILRRLLPDDPVVYVDVGAGEPCQCSNTWQFYQAGGRGLLIEPFAQWWPAILRQRPGDLLWPTAAGDRHGEARMRLCGPCSTIAPDWAIGPREEARVEVCTLAEILSHFPLIRDHCDFCDLDVEGFEREVLLGIDWDTFRPRVLCIEYVDYHPDHRGKEVQDRWEPLVLAQGYREVARTMGNIIYARGSGD